MGEPSIVGRSSEMGALEETTQTQRNIPTFNLENVNLVSYADVTEKLGTPNKDQGLIMTCEEGLNLSDYVNAICQTVKAQNVLFASKIAKNRISIFLNDKKLVTDITEKHEFLIIKDKKVTIRPLIGKYKRVIFSNVSPIISNRYIELILDQLKINRNSNVSFVKASLEASEHKHILSHRRQVYVKNEDADKIPGIFRLIFDDTEYYIYSSTDVLKCFACKMEGHIAKNCTLNICANKEISPEVSSNNSILNHTTLVPNTSTHTSPTQKAPIEVSHSHSLPQCSTVNKSDPTFKRPHTRSSSDTSAMSGDLINTPKVNKVKAKVSKKPKVNNNEELNKIQDEIETSLSPCIKTFTETEKPLSFDFQSFVEFIKKTYKCTSIVQQAFDLTKNTDEIIFAIDAVYDTIQGKNTKARITRIKKKLLKLNSNLDFHATEYNTNLTETSQEDKDSSSDLSDTDCDI